MTHCSVISGVTTFLWCVDWGPHVVVMRWRWFATQQGQTRGGFRWSAPSPLVVQAGFFKWRRVSRLMLLPSTHLHFSLSMCTRRAPQSKNILFSLVQSVMARQKIFISQQMEKDGTGHTDYSCELGTKHCCLRWSGIIRGGQVCFFSALLCSCVHMHHLFREAKFFKGMQVRGIHRLKF